METGREIEAHTGAAGSGGGGGGSKVARQVEGGAVGRCGGRQVEVAAVVVAGRWCGASMPKCQ